MIKRLHHVGIVTRDLDAAFPFYRDILGLPVDFSMELEQFKVKVAFLTAGEVQIELIQPLSGEIRAGQFLAERGEGLYHMALETDDIRRDVERLKSEVEVVQDVFHAGNGTYECMLRKGGVLVQLIQPGQPGPVRQA